MKSLLIEAFFKGQQVKFAIIKKNKSRCTFLKMSFQNHVRRFSYRSGYSADTDVILMICISSYQMFLTKMILYSTFFLLQDLLYVVPFIAKILEACAKSKVKLCFFWVLLLVYYQLWALVKLFGVFSVYIDLKSVLAS